MRQPLSHGGDVNAKDEEGKTALHLAAEENSHESIKVLLSHGAEVLRQHGGQA
jgi:ankyrin repeat protein